MFIYIYVGYLLCALGWNETKNVKTKNTKKKKTANLKKTLDLFWL